MTRERRNLTYPGAVPERVHPLDGVPAKPSLVCASCGYGVARAAGPERCPMCQRSTEWVAAARRLRRREPALG
jgi:rubrerythrin